MPFATRGADLVYLQHRGRARGKACPPEPANAGPTLIIRVAASPNNTEVCGLVVAWSAIFLELGNWLAFKV